MANETATASQVATTTTQRQKDDALEDSKDENKSTSNVTKTSDMNNDGSSACDDHQSSNNSSSLSTWLPSISQGVANKASPWELQSWVSLALTLDGRDKITKLLQYLSRLGAWYWASSTDGFQKAMALRCLALKVSLTTSRKAFRLGRSVIEVQKLRKMGFWSLLHWYLYQVVHGKSQNQPSLTTSTLNGKEGNECNGVHKESTASHQMAAKLLTMVESSSGSTKDPQPPSTPLLAILGSALKLCGLLGFWAGDNVSFLTQSGFLDNYQQPLDTRLKRRKQIVKTASQTANRFYFMGAVAGLVASLRMYLHFRVTKLVPLQEELDKAPDDTVREQAKEALRKAKTQQFELSLVVLKSCCDILVFSNNPGVDLWRKRHSGKPLHEGFHCLCGLTSASTVLYNNFPNITSGKK